MVLERVLRWTLVLVAVLGLLAGGIAYARQRGDIADLCFTLATVPVIAGLAVSMLRDLLAGRLGVDAIALVSMSAAIALGQPLAGAVVALMYAGGNVLEDIAVARAEHDLRSLVDRAPRQAHRSSGDHIVDVPIADVSVGDRLMVRAGEIVPVDGVIDSHAATVDESALTGEPVPVTKARGGAVLSGALNAGETFEMTATAPAGESTYAGIVRLVTAAQTAKAPFVRLADRYALIFLPVTRRIYRRGCAGGAAGHPRQGRRSDGGAGACAHRAVRQDRHANGRWRPAAFGRGGAGRERRSRAHPWRFAGAGLPSCVGQGYCPGRRRTRFEVQDARAGQGVDGRGAFRDHRRQTYQRRLARHGHHRWPDCPVGCARDPPRLLAVGTDRVHRGRRAA